VPISLSYTIPAAMKKLRIVALGFGSARQKVPLNAGQIPNFRGVRVALGAGYSRAEGNRRASRNGRVSDLPPEIRKGTIRRLFITVRKSGAGVGRVGRAYLG
jgi:hypothetical protein